MAVSGILYMGAMLLYLRAIQAEEASVVAPLFQMSTLFTFLIAYCPARRDAELGAGRRRRADRGGRAVAVARCVVPARPWKPRFVLLMLACTFVLALSSVLFKLFAVRDAFWPTTFWINAGEGLFGFAIIAVPHYRRQFVALFRQSPGAVMAINGANELINLGGGLGVRAASLLAPVALVSAVSSTSTLFVFAIGIGLTLFFPHLGREDLSRRALLQKGAGAALVAAGVALLGGPAGQ